MNEKKAINIWIISVVLFIPFVMGINYFTDPYGIRNIEAAFVKNVTKNNHIRILNKLNVKSDYYLLGTSRLLRVDPLDVQKHLNKKVHNINIEGSSFYENLFLAQEVKDRNKNVIFGFDAFTLNAQRKQSKRLNELIETKENYSLENLLQYASSQMLQDSLSHRAYKFLDKSREFYFEKENSTKTLKPTAAMINEKGKLYPNYEIISKEDIEKLAKLLDAEDRVVIYPKYYEYYKYFQTHNNIESAYFDAIKHLVKNTSAKVYIFYGINSITIDHNNFDKGGWHFKPRVGKEVFQCILKSKCNDNIGTLLRDENVAIYLKKLSNEIKGLIPILSEINRK